MSLTPGETDYPTQFRIWDWGRIVDKKSGEDHDEPSCLKVLRL